MSLNGCGQTDMGACAKCFIDQTGECLGVKLRRGEHESAEEVKMCYTEKCQKMCDGGAFESNWETMGELHTAVTDRSWMAQIRCPKELSECRSDDICKGLLDNKASPPTLEQPTVANAYAKNLFDCMQGRVIFNPVKLVPGNSDPALNPPTNGEELDPSMKKLEDMTAEEVFKIREESEKLALEAKKSTPAPALQPAVATATTGGAVAATPTGVAATTATQVMPQATPALAQPALGAAAGAVQQPTAATTAGAGTPPVAPTAGAATTAATTAAGAAKTSNGLIEVLGEEDFAGQNLIEVGDVLDENHVLLEDDGAETRRPLPQESSFAEVELPVKQLRGNKWHQNTRLSM